MNGADSCAERQTNSTDKGADMKRWLLTLPVLLGGILGLAQANYVVVVVNVGGVKSAPDPKSPQPGMGIGTADTAQDIEQDPRLIVGIVELQSWPGADELKIYATTVASGKTGEAPKLLYPAMIHHRYGGYTPVVSGESILGVKDEQNTKGSKQELMEKVPGVAFLYGQKAKVTFP